MCVLNRTIRSRCCYPVIALATEVRASSDGACEQSAVMSVPLSAGCHWRLARQCDPPHALTLDLARVPHPALRVGDGPGHDLNNNCGTGFQPVDFPLGPKGATACSHACREFAAAERPPRRSGANERNPWTSHTPLYLSPPPTRHPTSHKRQRPVIPPGDRGRDRRSWPSILTYAPTCNDPAKPQNGIF